MATELTSSISSDVATEGITTEKVKKKKKKKKKASEVPMTELEVPTDSTAELKETATDLMDVTGDTGTISSDVVAEVETATEKPRKKKKKSIAVEEGIEEVTEVSVDATETKKKKKKKDKKKVEAENTVEENETPTVAEAKESTPYAGQWKTASLGSEARSDKFLRLMGGFKASTKLKAEKKKTFASAALSGRREQQLLRGLESQFEQARETSITNRGLGLGFDPNKDDSQSRPGFNFPK